MASDMRFGLEIEYLAIQLTLRQRGTDNWWAAAVDNVSQKSTMIGVDPILVPLNQTTYFSGLSLERKIRWESDWGFQGVGSRHDRLTMNPDGRSPRDIGYCIIELVTATNRVSDATYWINSRVCSKEFLATINEYKSNTIDDPQQVIDEYNRWYPLQSFLDRYNTRLDHLSDRTGFESPEERNKFKLQKSARILQFEAEAPVTVGGEEVTGQWDAYFHVVEGSLMQFCNVKVNYQMSLGTLHDSTEQWTRSWASMWVWEFGGYGREPLDPNIGDADAVSLQDAYRVQICAAMWRKAKAFVDDAASLPLALNGLKATTPLVKALVMYLLVCGTITPDDRGNIAFPQLPKTSPASMAHAIASTSSEAKDSFVRLRNTDSDEFNRVETFCATKLRDRKFLASPPGNLPRTGPQETDRAFSSVDYGMLSTFPETFSRTWTATFNLAHTLSNDNNFGYDARDPFYCLWAHGVDSSVPATVLDLSGSAASDIKIVMQSCIGRSIMNYGFNPYIDDFMFNRSYLSMVKLLAAEQQFLEARQIVDSVFPDDPQMKQDFSNGPH